MLKNIRNTARKYGNKVALVGSSLALMAAQAHAELPAEVTGAVSAAKTDALLVAGGFVGAIVVVGALMLVIRAVRS